MQSHLAGHGEPRTSALRQVQADGAVLIVGAEIRFRVATLMPGFLILTVAGGRSQHVEDVRAEKAMLQELTAELERAGALTVFADMRESSRMSAQSREVATEWLRAHRDGVLGSHVLVRSKLIEMAMSIVAMLVGGGLLHVYSRPQRFLDVIRAVAPNFGVLPTIPQLPRAVAVQPRL